MNLLPSRVSRLPSASTVKSRRLLRLFLAVLAGSWAGLVLSVYYGQLWGLLTGSGWDVLGAYVVSARIFLAGLGFLGLAFVVFLVVARDGIGERTVHRRTAARDVALLAGLVAAFGLLTLLSGGRLIDPALPFLAAALGRAVAGIGGAALLLFAAFTLGDWLGRALGWRYAGFLEQLPFALVLGIGAFAYGGLALAAFGLYRPLVLLTAVALVLAGALVQVLVHLRRQGLPRLARPAFPSLPAGATPIGITCAGLASPM